MRPAFGSGVPGKRDSGQTVLYALTDRVRFGSPQGLVGSAGRPNPSPDSNPIPNPDPDPDPHSHTNSHAHADRSSVRLTLTLTLTLTGRLYVSDKESCSMRVISLIENFNPGYPVQSEGAVRTVLGSARESSDDSNGVGDAALLGGYGDTDGTGSGARLTLPTGLCLLTPTLLAMADTLNNRIKLVDISSDTAQSFTLLGSGTGTEGSSSSSSSGISDDGSGTNVLLRSPQGVAFDSALGVLYVADTGHDRVLACTLTGTGVGVGGSVRPSIARVQVLEIKN